MKNINIIDLYPDKDEVFLSKNPDLQRKLIKLGHSFTTAIAEDNKELASKIIIEARILKGTIGVKYQIVVYGASFLSRDEREKTISNFKKFMKKSRESFIKRLDFDTHFSIEFDAVFPTKKGVVVLSMSAPGPAMDRLSTYFETGKIKLPIYHATSIIESFFVAFDVLGLSKKYGITDIGCFQNSMEFTGTALSNYYRWK